MVNRTKDKIGVTYLLMASLGLDPSLRQVLHQLNLYPFIALLLDHDMTGLFGSTQADYPIYFPLWNNLV